MESDDLVQYRSRYWRAPFVLVVLRIFLAFVLLIAISLEYLEISIVAYALAFITDVLDGRIAKWMKITTSSAIEAYLDPVADFIFVLLSFYAFSLKSIYSPLLLVQFIIMFVFFIITSNDSKPLYDPIGKYYGIYLFITIGLTIVFQETLVFNFVLVSVIFYSIILVLYRSIFLWKKRKEN